MKKTLAFGILAICLIALSHQPASAWTNSKFSFGIDWQHQTGNNGFCKIWKNGQVPGPEAFGATPNFDFQTPVTPVTPVPVAPVVPAPLPRASFDAFEYGAPAFAMPAQSSPFQFATFARPTFEYPVPYFGR